jgi:hypothetical protein
MSSRAKIVAAAKLSKKNQGVPSKKQHRYPVKLDILLGKIKKSNHPNPHKPGKPYVPSTRLDKWVWDTLMSAKEEEKSIPKDKVNSAMESFPKSIPVPRQQMSEPTKPMAVPRPMAEPSKPTSFPQQMSEPTKPMTFPQPMAVPRPVADPSKPTSFQQQMEVPRPMAFPQLIENKPLSGSAKRYQRSGF